MENRSFFNPILFMGSLTAMLVFFQIHIKYGLVAFNLNLADIFALAGLVLGIDSLISKKIIFEFPYTRFFILSSFLSLLFALIIGWIHFGSSSWAFLTRFLGWFIIIGYFFLGALVINNQKEHGLRQITSIMFNTYLSVIFIILISFYIRKYYWNLPTGMAYLQAGFSATRNSFCFEILSVLALVGGSYCAKSFKISEKHLLSISILLFGVYLTHSRSGLLLAGLFLILFYTLRILSFKNIIKVLFYTLIINFLFLIVWEIFTSPTLIPHHSRPLSSLLRYSKPTSNVERFFSIIEALNLWKEHFLIGTGLGGFVHHMHLHHKIFLVIHSGYIFLLTELGILGSLPFVWYGSQILKNLYQKISNRLSGKNLSAQEAIFVFICLLFLVMNCFHDMLYQRIFWFIFGMCVVCTKRSFSAPCSSH
jgi:hypothetical protein